ncbi:MAG: hypothetical protein IID41_04080 [Planctomycetes bacterium]|nr:hypothetical protein [Planctomycetota bacterium]
MLRKRGPPRDGNSHQRCREGGTQRRSGGKGSADKTCSRDRKQRAADRAHHERHPPPTYAPAKVRHVGQLTSVVQPIRRDQHEDESDETERPQTTQQHAEQQAPCRQANGSSGAVALR